MSARTISRTRLLAATTVALATFALTACDGGEGDGAREEGRSPAASELGTRSGGSGGSDESAEGATADPDAAPAEDGDAPAGDGDPDGGSGADAGTDAGTDGGSDRGTDAGSVGGPGTSDGGDEGNPACDGSTTRTTATLVSRPLNRLLLTVTNTSSMNCDLVGYPAVRFGEAQSVPPVDESTKPQAVVTLAPGESGYAGVHLSAADGSGQHGYTTRFLTVAFGASDAMARPSLPAKGVYVDSSLRVTYWQHTMDEALR